MERGRPARDEGISVRGHTKYCFTHLVWSLDFFSTKQPITRVSTSGVLLLPTLLSVRQKFPNEFVTLLGNILLRSIVVSVLIRLINGYSVTDGT